MALIKWEPFGDLDRFFDDMPVMSKMGFDLAVDVFEKDGNVIAQMNLPGIDPAKIDVSIDEGLLRIAGSREESKEEKDKQYYAKEIRRGSFERVVRLPAAVDRAKATANYKNGELTITLPKLTERESGTVKVEVSH